MSGTYSKNTDAKCTKEWTNFTIYQIYFLFVKFWGQDEQQVKCFISWPRPMSERNPWVTVWADWIICLSYSVYSVDELPVVFASSERWMPVRDWLVHGQPGHPNSLPPHERPHMKTGKKKEVPRREVETMYNYMRKFANTSTPTAAHLECSDKEILQCAGPAGCKCSNFSECSNNLQSIRPQSLP